MIHWETNLAIAQLVARLHGVQEAVGSSPTSQTKLKRRLEAFFFIQRVTLIDAIVVGTAIR